ncbi:methionine ABC transporter ATP-binding protein [Enterococcus hirae]|uniref:methionine ABC transporter ATP-binding protein n=2 Tax=Enterococcus TaxID=1350 RepID=UPI001F604ADA|nr:ATP-binding cassette domain-containing protein [Enterococcus hirae]
MISFEHVSKSFGGTMILNDLNLFIPKGKIFGIIGRSGAGKSTMIRLINGLDQPTKGKISLSQDVKSSTIFQHYALLQSKTVADNIRLALRFSKVNKQEYDKRIENVLRYVSMIEKKSTYPSHLSGGQKQRVGIARALVTEPSLLLCDEITSALDPTAKKSILNLLKKVNEELGTTIILVTHEMEAIKEICDEVAVIDSGKVIEQATTKKMFLSPQSNLVREFLADMIYPKYPKKESISFNYVLYFLMNATNYARFQESKMEGTVYDIKTIHISGERFFAMYFLTNKIPDNEFIDQLISYEKVTVDV